MHNFTFFSLFKRTLFTVVVSTFLLFSYSASSQNIVDTNGNGVIEESDDWPISERFSEEYIKEYNATLRNRALVYSQINSDNFNRTTSPSPVGSCNLITCGSFNYDDVTFNTDWGGERVGVDGSRYGANVAYSCWHDNGTVDYSEGQYISYSFSQANVFTPGIISQAPDGDGFAIFSFQDESINQTLSVLPNANHTVCFEIAVIPRYSNDDGTFVEYQPNLDFGISSGGISIGDPLTYTHNDLTSHNTSEFPPALSTATTGTWQNAGGWTEIDPYWETVCITFQTDSSGSVNVYYNTGNPGRSVVLVDGLRLSLEGYAVAPTLDDVAPLCAPATVDLDDYVTSTGPPNSTLTWSTNVDPLVLGDHLTDTNLSSSGTFYAFYYNSTDNCASPAVQLDLVIGDCTTIDDWVFDCGDDKVVDEYGYNANCNTTTVATIPSSGSVYQYVVEMVYKGSNPGSAVQVLDDTNTPHVIERSVPVGSSSNIWVYRGLITGSTSTITYVDNVKQCKLQSLVVYAFRDIVDATPSSGVFTSRSGVNDIQTIDITIPSFTSIRDLVIEAPVSELTPDGRYLKIMAEAGGITDEIFLYGPDSSLPGGTCCLAIPTLTLDNVPGGVTQVTITVDSRNGQNGQTVNGQSWVIASGVNVDTPCFEDLEIELDNKEDVLCNGDNTGSITVSATGGVPPLLYSLNSGTPQTDTTFDNLPAGAYTVTVVDDNGNAASISVTISEPDAISIQMTKIDPTESGGCANGEATATPSGGTPPFTYQWSASAGNQTTQTATNLPGGTHTVIVEDANKCILSQGVVMNCVPDCDAVISVDNVVNVLCTGDMTGSATVGASSIANPGASFTFTWNTGTVTSGTTSTLSGLGAGVYTVSVTIDGTVCLPVEQSVTITEPSNALNVTASATDESGPTTGDGTATASPSGGTPPYTFVWSPGGETTQTITGLSAGNYTVTVTDANGCTAMATTTVNPGTCLDLAATASATPVSCNGGNDGTATVGVLGGSGSITYSWSPGGETTQSITGLAAGTYVVTVFDTVTQCSVQSTTTVNEPSALSSGIAVNNVLCFGEDTGSLDLTVTGGTSPYTFAWSPNGETTEDIFGLVAGTYSVVITDANGCTTSDSAEVLQPASGLELAYTVVDVLCNGDATGSIDITVTGGTPPYSYTWNNGTSTEDQTNVAAGVYNVSVTDANGCTISENGIIIDQPANEISIQITKINATTAQGCLDGEATATPSGGTAPYTYLWSASAGNQTTMTATNLPSGAHTVVVTDANNCFLEQGVVIDCNDTCDQVIEVDNIIDVLCKGDLTGSATVSASSIANPGATFTFTWNTVPPQVDSGVATSTVSDLGAGVYVVSVTIDGTVCAAVEQSVTITEPTNALSVSASATDESGPTTGDGTATASPSGGTPPYTYVWSPGGETTQTITGLSAGNYTVTVTDANGCTAMATTTVNPGTCLDLAVTATSTPVTCNGDSDGTATASVTGGSGTITYLWSPGGETTQTITALVAGAYTVTVTDGITQCVVQSTTNVTQPNVLSSGIAVTNVNCFGDATGSLDLTVTGGTAPYTFVWSPNNETTEDLFNLVAGTYSVVITDVNGCTTTDSATVTQPDAALSLSITAQTDIVCTGVGSVTVEAAGGTVPYTYNIDGGTFQSSGTFDNLTVGLHTVSALDANGCTTSIDVTILTNCILAIDDINNTFVNLPVSGNVGTNDENPDGPAGTEVFTLVTGPTNGSVVLNADGTYTYTPAMDYVGEDTFEYQVCDAGNPVACDTAIVYIEILPIGSPDNDPPVANADTNTTEVDTPVMGTVLPNDFDPDGDPITVTANTQPANGTVVMNPDGTYTYTPNAGFEGEDTFEYTICDDGTPALCDTATVTIQVIPDNGNITVANDDAYNGTPGNPINGSVLDNDNDPEGDTQTVNTTPVSGPANGTVVLNADGTFVYTPNDPTFVGTDQFVYEVCDDGTPQACDQATVYITIGDDGNEILAIDDINNTFVNLPVSGNVGTNDENPDGPAGTEVFTLVTGPTNGSVVLNADGTYTYTPAMDYVGEDTFEYQVCDAGNPVACDTAIVYIEILPIGSPDNDPPVANADTNTTEVDTPVMGTVLPNDFDPDGDPITVTANTQPANGTVVMNPDGTYTYTPNAGFEGEDTFEYTICDDGTPALCDTATVTIQVIPDNGNITVANDDAYNGTPGNPINGSVLDNDNDPEGDTQTVNTTPVSGPANGTVVLNADGTFVYTPNDPTFVGTDQFVYEVCDDGTPQACDQATVYITIGDDGNEILAIDDINNTFVNLPVSGNVGTNDENPDGPAGTEVFTLVTGPTNGSVVLNADGTYTYTPAMDYVGEDTFEYQVCDAGNPVACDTAIVYIEILPIGSPDNDPPVANADTNTTEVDTPVMGTVLPNDFDPDGDPITVTANTQPANGTVVMNPDGTYTYTPNAGFEGEDTFEYTNL